MDGQVDLFDMPEFAPAKPVDDWKPGRSCSACGHVFISRWDDSINHSWMPLEGICTPMSLTRSHVEYWCMVLAGKYQSPDKKCCHGAIKSHVGKERREYWLDHLRQDLTEAFRRWKETPWLQPMLEKYDLDREELAVWLGPHDIPEWAMATIYKQQEGG